MPDRLTDTKHILIPQVPDSWRVGEQLLQLDWDSIPSLSPFLRCENGEPALQQTTTHVACNAFALFVRFDCDDDDIWGTYTERDQPLYDEEVVEVQIGWGEPDPKIYYEFEISPDGILFDAIIKNPTSDRKDIAVDTTWDCAGVRWEAVRRDSQARWSASLMIPWMSISPSPEIPPFWRANFCRIERPRHGESEFSCWSPTLTDPADFHKPAYFGTLNLPQF